MTESRPDQPAHAVITNYAGIASRPLLGRLPLARLIAQDLHSLVDYVGAAFVATCSLFATSELARTTGLALATIGLVVSLLTNYRLSMVKLIPIEIHEVMDYTLGVLLVVAPWLLGYWQVASTVSTLHVLSGATLLAMAPFTDYRAWRVKNS